MWRWRAPPRNLHPIVRTELRAKPSAMLSNMPRRNRSWRTGHFGIHGMRERTELMDGKLTVWTAAVSGTEIEIIIPAARAQIGEPCDLK